jgi:hypothetical protein
MADESYTVAAHPDTGEPVVDLQHGRFGLGCKSQSVSAYAGRYPPLSAALPPIPAGAWTEQDFRPFCRPVMDQGQSSSCCPHAAVEAIHTGFALTSDERPLLSPWFLYGQINDGRDQGAAIPDALQVSEAVGVPPDELVRRGDMFGPYSAEAKRAAARFRIETAYDLQTWDDLLSAVERDFPCVIGVDIGKAFTPDGEGFLPDFRSAGRILGHAISVQGKRYARGKWWPLVQNHWTRQWGLDGFAHMPASYWNPYFGAWALRVVRLDPAGPNPPAAG